MDHKMYQKEDEVKANLLNQINQVISELEDENEEVIEAIANNEL